MHIYPLLHLPKAAVAQGALGLLHGSAWMGKGSTVATVGSAGLLTSL